MTLASVPAAGPAAVLLDLDGTLIDTVRIWRSAYLQLAKELAAALPEDFWPSIAGLSMRGSLAVFGPSAERHDPDVLVARLVAIAARELERPAPATGTSAAGVDSTTGWTWLPGAPELLELLWSPGPSGRLASPPPPLPPLPRTALVTSAWRSFTTSLLDVALRDAALDDGFAAIVCGDDVARSKPAPDPYLRAAELLGVAPDDCLVIEDSPTGVASAEAAGMVVLAVAHAAPIPATPSRAVRDDLVGLTLDDLAAIQARLRSGSAH